MQILEIDISNFIRTRDREVPKRLSTFRVIFTLNKIHFQSLVNFTSFLLEIMRFRKGWNCLLFMQYWQICIGLFVTVFFFFVLAFVKTVNFYNFCQFLLFLIHIFHYACQKYCIKLCKVVLNTAQNRIIIFQFALLDEYFQNMWFCKCFLT